MTEKSFDLDHSQPSAPRRTPNHEIYSIATTTTNTNTFLYYHQAYVPTPTTTDTLVDVTHDHDISFGIRDIPEDTIRGCSP
jgi:hypothetical protein